MKLFIFSQKDAFEFYVVIPYNTLTTKFKHLLKRKRDTCISHNFWTLKHRNFMSEMFSKTHSKAFGFKNFRIYLHKKKCLNN